MLSNAIDRAYKNVVTQLTNIAEVDNWEARDTAIGYLRASYLFLAGNFKEERYSEFMAMILALLDKDVQDFHAMMKERK